MGIYRASKRAALILALVTVPLLAACGDDEPTNVIDDALLGDWAVTSFSIAGIGEIVAGSSLEIAISFTADSYSFGVTSDLLGIFCDTGTDCTETGDYSVSGSSLTFDPGTVDEVSFTYSISGNTLTASGTIEGDAVTLSADKI